MARQNITISLPERLAKEARHIAVDKGLSLSAYVASILEEQIETAKERSRLKKELLELLETGMDLGMPEKITWTREELHER